MQIPWPQIDSVAALIFGIVGAGLAWLGYRAGVRSHDSSLRVETQTLADTTKRIIDEVAEERGYLLKWYQHLYAARGQFYSGAMEVKKREFDGFAEKIEGLKTELAATEGINRLGGRKLERSLVEMRSIHRRALAISDKFAQYQRELREDAAEHRTQALQAFWAKQEPGR